jgi:hypothetical protein
MIIGLAFHQQYTFHLNQVSCNRHLPQPPLLAVFFFLRRFLFFFSLCLSSSLRFFAFGVSHFPFLPLGVRMICLLCMTGSLLHLREHPLVRCSRWPDPQNGILDKSLNIARGLCRLPTPHNITNLYNIQSATNSSFIQPDPASALPPAIRLAFIVDRFHQVGCSR